MSLKMLAMTTILLIILEIKDIRWKNHQLKPKKMAKTREKKTVYSGITSEQMEQAFADYAKADARQQKINAEMDVQMTRIREKWQDELAKLAETKDNALKERDRVMRELVEDPKGKYIVID